MFFFFFKVMKVRVSMTIGGPARSHLAQVSVTTMEKSPSNETNKKKEVQVANRGRKREKKIR